MPLIGFSDDGLSAICTKIGKPLMLDSYTSNMCVESWGRLSFARAMLEVSSLNELKDKLVVAIPKLECGGCIRNQIRVEYEWKPPRCSHCKVFGHVDAKCAKNVTQQVPKVVIKDGDGFQVVKKKSKGFNMSYPKKTTMEYRPKMQQKKNVEPMNVAETNPFEILRKADAEHTKQDQEGNNGKGKNKQLDTRILEKDSRFKEGIVEDWEEESDVDPEVNETAKFFNIPNTTNSKGASTPSKHVIND